MVESRYEVLVWNKESTECLYVLSNLGIYESFCKFYNILEEFHIEKMSRVT